jgi:hypothetical protein
MLKGSIRQKRHKNKSNPGKSPSETEDGAPGAHAWQRVAQ